MRRATRLILFYSDVLPYKFFNSIKEDPIIEQILKPTADEHHIETQREYCKDDEVFQDSHIKALEE